MPFMEKKKLTMLILGSMLSTAHGEDFINAGKELKSFSFPYDFGKPVRREEEESETGGPVVRDDLNTTPVKETAGTSVPKKELRKELNITCGAKCGISFKADDNDS